MQNKRIVVIFVATGVFRVGERRRLVDFKHQVHEFLQMQ